MYSEEYDESLQYSYVSGIEEACTGKCVFNCETVPGQEDSFGFTEFSNTVP
jgi:hypothetical protein